MNYQEARLYLDELSKYGSVLGLESMRELLKRLGDPQKDLRFVHIAGTNGKGSVLAYLSTVLTQAGYRTGRYLSPHLCSVRERFQVDGQMISRENFVRYLTAVAEAAEEMADAGVGRPTYFEVGTAVAMLHFRETNCDIVVLETGLGGSLDATNVVETSVLEIITSISRDHMEVLGDTLEKIAGEKAGIIKPHTMVVSARQEPEAARVLEEVCRARQCTLDTVDLDQVIPLSRGLEEQCFTYKGWERVRIGLTGTYQLKNAALALESVLELRKLGFAISDQQVYEGMRRTVWRGRFTPIAREPAVILDGAHNEGGARELRDSLQLYFGDKKLYYIFGILKDKAYEKVIDLTAPLASRIITVETPDNPRAMPAQELKAAVAAVNPAVEAAGSLREAVHRAYGLAGRDDVIVIFGSLSFLSDVEQCVLEEVAHG